MKKIFALYIALFSCFAAIAQQEQQYTQFMYNKMDYNPAYAGSNDAVCITGIYRNQWIGLKGSPKSQLLNFNMPLSHGRVGIGASLTHHNIGIEDRITAQGSYAYRVPMGRGNLAIGVNAAVRYAAITYDPLALNATQDLGSDPAVTIGKQSRVLPNFGAGAYFNTKKFYIGLSLPRLLMNNISFSDKSVGLSKEFRHLYLMSGAIFPLTETIKLQPQALLKYVPNAPFSAEMNMSVLFVDRFLVGGTYRTGGSTKKGLGESLDVLFGAQITDNIMLGLSYDLGLSELKTYHNGTLEATLRYCLQQSEGLEFVNPRYF
ncbi:MAG: hypothetical protein RLZZ292_1143 [Bacteroidota bacterium]|jgi:type IX secretion system PorP/SprF family membrane protein